MDKMTSFHIHVTRVCAVAICTTVLSTVPMPAQKGSSDLTTSPEQQDATASM